MSAVDQYLADLSDALHVRGATRRRFLHEVRDHLSDAAEVGGELRAVAAFGAPAEVAAAFDAEVATRRALRSTALTLAGLIAIAGSTLALIHAAAPGASGPPWLAAAFFVSAQVAGVAACTAAVQALVLRRSPASPPADVALLSRRNGCALTAAAVTMLAAGAAVPGQGSATLLLAGPVLVAVAGVTVVRTARLARRLEGAGATVDRPPLEDVARLVRLPPPTLGEQPLVGLTTIAAALAAFAWDRGEHASATGALIVAAVEASAVVVAYVLLRRTLGLRPDD